MKCEHCGAQNPIRAKYCFSCGKKLSSELQEEAYQKTFWGKLENLQKKIEKWKSLKNFSFLTENKFVRAFVLLGLLVWMVGSMLANGLSLKLLNGAAYRIACQKETNTYYILTDQESVTVHVYFPVFVKEANLQTFSKDQETSSMSIDFESQEGVTVKQSQEEYYVLSSVNEFGQEKQIVFVVCPEEP